MDEKTAEDLDRVAPRETEQRTDFIREAIRQALLKTEEERTRRAYSALPDSEDEADDWSDAEEYRG